MKKSFCAAGFFMCLATGWLRAETPKIVSEAKVESVQSVIERVKLKNPNLPIRLFAQGKNLTVNVVTPTTPLKPHLHARHEEVIYLIQGKGKMRLGDKTWELKAGDIVYIPLKTLHAFTPEGGDCRALSLFAPAFDGKDRVFVKE